MPMPQPMPMPMPMPMPQPMPYPEVIMEPASCGGTYPCKDKGSKGKKHHDKKEKKLDKKAKNDQFMRQMPRIYVILFPNDFALKKIVEQTDRV